MAKASDNEFPSVLFGELGSAPTTPASGNWRLFTKSDGLYLVDDAGAVTGPFVASGGSLTSDGWVAAGETWTYAAADAPTFTFTVAGIDLTTKYSAGMRIRISQSTGGTKYFIITAVAFSTNTTITIYGGTDYTLNNETISSPYFSVVKSPFGFPLNPAKWTVEVTDTSTRTQNTPTQNVWYNLGSVVITIPIGCWRTLKEVHSGTDRATAATLIVSTTLSTANNSESDADFTDRVVATTALVSIGATASREKILDLTVKTAYYLNTRTEAASASNIYNLNASSKLILRAVCAFL